MYKRCSENRILNVFTFRNYIVPFLSFLASEEVSLVDPPSGGLGGMEVYHDP